MREDSLKVKAYFDLFWDYHRKDYDSSLKYATNAEKLSKKLGLDFQLADAHRIKSFSLSGMGRLKEAKVELQKASEIFRRLKDQKMIAGILTEFGWISMTQSNFEEGLTFFWDALRISEEIGNKDNMAQNLNYIAEIYVEQKQYGKAIENYKKALALVEGLGIKPGISACLTNLASVYTITGEYEQALHMNSKALELKIEMGDLLGEARVNTNLGTLHNKLRNFGDAERNFERALILLQKVGDTHTISILQLEIARFNFNQGNYSKSLEIANGLYKRIDPYEELELSVKLRKLLFETYGKIGRYEKAHIIALEWKTLSDSLYSKNMLAVTNELEAKYQNEQKTKEIALLASEKELQALQLNKRESERNAIIAFALLVLLLGALIYNQYRIKQKSNKELRELDRLKSNFFANVSHEFRTPLTLIKGPIEKLEQNPDESLNRQEVKMIRRNANKVLHLVNQLLMLSKIDQGNVKLKLTEGDLYKCLRVAASSFNSHAAQRAMDYRVEIPNDVFWAAFDRDKVEKVVYNLLSNAFKFTNDEGLVTFKVNHENEELNIQISDSGKGIPEEEQPFIFNRFYQVDGSSTKEHEGSGIGLSLSKDLIALMDGTITVSSEEGKGTYFTVQFPIEQIETGQISELKTKLSITKETAKAPSFELSKVDKRDVPEILLVEDNQDMRQFIKAHLLKDFKINEAKNGKEGLKKAMAAPPDLLITDLMMPKMDGVELCKQLKSNVETSHVPVIMLTAKAGLENKIEGLEIGADEYLTKPFEYKELLVRIKNLIEQRKKLREHYTKTNLVLGPKKIKAHSIDQKFLEQVFDLLEKKYSNANFGVPQMQEELSMSKTQLHRKLKALTNESPGELLRNFRLKRAAQLLSLKADTVTQIAYQVGFNNLSYFAKCFKETYGVSPSSY